jgi:hypothetical protein
MKPCGPSNGKSAMTTFGWLTRLKYGVLAAVAGWFAAWAVSFPFELSLAWRYVDQNARQLPESFAKGLVVWAGFSFFLVMAGFLPLMLPPVLLIPPGWIVRWRRILIPLAPLAAMAAIYAHIGFLGDYYFRHRWKPRFYLFTGPNFFIVTFALVAVWFYTVLAKRRLSSQVTAK